MNLHPFELKIEQLETLNKELETLNSQEAEQAVGGFIDGITTWMTGEEGGNPITFGYEGGITPPISDAIGETGTSHRFLENGGSFSRSCGETGC